MSPARAAGVALLLGCSSAPNMSDTVVAEVSGPPHARILEREHDTPADCTGTSGIVDRLSCIFRSTTQQCRWLEVDSSELAGHPFGQGLADCQGLTHLGPRVALTSLSPTSLPTLEADPSGTRLAVASGANLLVLWVLDGSVVGAAMPTPPLDWATVGRLDERLGSFFETGDDDARERLLAYAEQHGGDEAIVSLMQPIASSSIDQWHGLYRRLESPEQKAKARGAMHALLTPEPPVELVSGLIDYPDVQPPRFQKLMLDVVNAQVAEFTDWYTIAPLLEELERLGEPSVPDIACRLYGMRVLSSSTGAMDEYYDETSDPVFEAAVLQIIGRHDAACPWVRIALERDPCSGALRCQTDGGLPDGEESTFYDEETGEERYLAQPLCGPRATSKALSPIPGTAEGREEEGEALVLSNGVFLLAAAYRQNAVSKELVARNARRLYRYQYPAMPKPSAEEEGAEVSQEAPCSRPRALPDAVCRLPLDVTLATFNGCRLRIDDKAQVVRVEELKPK